ncbi:GNAT family N-acetyltransferase [Bacillus sp. FJAT-45037]|uniref:GNAT family N-acetyltransferase n=1 Tax=Bacillus sp. FJAT-45037 TaxID=2011007 RepID=UPI000C23C93D|nr:GNAT family N-acetyltransferase [Bacillus sp. FJAT-45037]
MNWIFKRYDQLTTDELYSILQLRVEVFVVEQQCPYMELDAKDQVALHVLGYEHDQLVAYSRLFMPQSHDDNASIGRVIVRKEFRSEGYGKELLETSIFELRRTHPIATIYIQAQHYLLSFYQSFGFKETSDVYDEDGIPHIDMMLEKE